jgi:hypothetical protein
MLFEFWLLHIRNMQLCELFCDLSLRFKILEIDYLTPIQDFKSSVMEHYILSWSILGYHEQLVYLVLPCLVFI